MVVHSLGLALGLLVAEDYAEAVAADGGVTHHGVRVACYLASQRRQLFFIEWARGRDVVEVDHAKACEAPYVLLALAAVEEAGDSEEWGLHLDVLASCLAIGFC